MSRKLLYRTIPLTLLSLFGLVAIVGFTALVNVAMPLAIVAGVGIGLYYLLPSKK
jgi:hypothetical protein